MIPTGYRHALYAASFAEFGRPRPLPRSGGWVLERDIPGTGQRDGMGLYPLFVCPDWNALPDDLAPRPHVRHDETVARDENPFLGVTRPGVLAACVSVRTLFRRFRDDVVREPAAR